MSRFVADGVETNLTRAWSGQDSASLTPQIPAPAGSQSDTGSGNSEMNHEAGTFKTWPTWRRLASSPGFADIKALNLTLYFLAIADGVSPG